MKTQFHNSKLWRLMDTNGDYVNYTYFLYINEFHDGYAWVKPAENSSGTRMINTNGEIIKNWYVSEGHKIISCIEELDGDYGMILGSNAKKSVEINDDNLKFIELIDEMDIISSHRI